MDIPLVLDDPVAVAILGERAASELRKKTATDEDRFSRALRAMMAVRSRYAEDQLATEVSRGVRQYVVLGAGLDTYAYRNRFRDQGLRVFEVDHPATQAWKRELLVWRGSRCHRNFRSCLSTLSSRAWARNYGSPASAA
jgi:methyltransferase (TIGR00027 family)